MPGARAANAFLATLDATELSETQHPFTLSYAEHWSNLPGVIRNGPSPGPESAIGTATGTAAGPGGAFGGGSTVTLPSFTMNDTQRAATQALAQAALSRIDFATMQQIRAADDVLGAIGPSGYGSGNYHVATLGTPSTTAPCMPEIGGHHLAYNIAYNAAEVSATPVFVGAEPPNFSVLAWTAGVWPWASSGSTSASK